MNNKEFIAELASRTGLKADETQKLMNTVLGAMGDCFQEGSAVQLPTFGVFEVKKKLERIMVNPTTGQRMLVPPKLVLAFKPNVTWKDKIKKGGNE
ncbi:MAG: HU family DNA-binding protein [Prevotella sp.]|nr:HU family DNA-binding protein [Prevotella sp.]